MAERRVAAAIVAQRWMRRVWRDRAAIGAAVLKVSEHAKCEGSGKGFPFGAFFFSVPWGHSRE